MRSLLLIGAVLVSTAALRAADPLLELTVGDQSYVGCAVAHNDQVCWLAHADGQLSRLDVPSVTSFRRVNEQFRGMTALEARNTLRRELGPGWVVVGTGHYLVCATTDNGRAYAQHFEDLYRSFRRYFARRDFDLPDPEFPLIAIVHANAADFAAQCQRDGMPYTRTLRGYYHRHTNRICLYEQDGDVVQRESQDGTHRVPSGQQPPIVASFQGSLKDTIVHEATHQLAFNMGLHSRIGQPPRWVVEGLATMFEADGTRGNTGGSAPGERVNPERLWWFSRIRQQLEPGELSRFVASPDSISGSVLDFYAYSWALTFYLAETRPQQYAAYLRQVADRDPLQVYSARERLSDFQSAFGTDLARIEVDMLRFIDELQ